MLRDFVLAFYIAKKDIKEYYLKPPTISWGIVFPVAFTMAFMFKTGKSFYEMLPGLIILALFFGTTSMTSASIVFERRVGSFERYLLFPISYFGIALGKTLSGFLFGLVSLLAIIALVVPIALHSCLFSISLICVLLLSSLMFSAFGVFVSFLVEDPTNTMVIMNSIRFPMIFLCGIFIPLSKLPYYLKVLSLLVILTYSVEASRYAMTGRYEMIPPSVSVASIVAITILFLFLASLQIRSVKT